VPAFVLIVHSEDTHSLFAVDEAWLDRRPDLKTWPKSRALFESADLLIAWLMADGQELGLENGIEIMVYGDHLLWNKPRWYEDASDRRLLTAFADQKHGCIAKGTRWYDVAPTLLEIIGIEAYDSPLPFNENIFSDLIGDAPPIGTASTYRT
jgi:hypothetical protein